MPAAAAAKVDAARRNREGMRGTVAERVCVAAAAAVDGRAGIDPTRITRGLHCAADEEIPDEENEDGFEVDTDRNKGLFLKRLC